MHLEAQGSITFPDDGRMEMTELSFAVPITLAERIERMAAHQGIAVSALLCEMSARMVEEFEAFDKFCLSAQVSATDAEEAAA